MARHLPYRMTTSSGNRFDFEFPLHPETVDPVQVSQLLDAILGALDREIRLLGNVGNGDLLQALAMAIVARTRMLPGPAERLEGLVRDLVEAALSARVEPDDGNVPPGAPREVH